MSLSGKVAIVTGGSGALGGPVVKALLDAGASVVVPYHRPGEFAALPGRLGLATDAPLTGEPLDLTDEAAVGATFQRVAQAQGGIDILINLAGGFAGGSPAHETGWSVWQQQLELNLKTAVLACAAVTPHMIARGGGSIVNVGTRTATQPAAKYAAYAAAKRAVLQLTEALAAELREHGITVNSILPSTIDTPGNRHSMPNADFSRWVAPDEIAQVILFLVGPDARIISGAHIPVYGRA